MITVKNLVKRHGKLEVLKGISLEVKKGEVAAVIGPSGGGKSTFLRCINGLDTFQGGEIKVGSATLTSATSARKDSRLLQSVRQTVGFVFQQFNLFPHLTTLENVMEAPIQVLGKSRDEAAAKGKQLLTRVGLGAKLDALPRHLSGGQQQRVAIARALAMQPAAILFDEPTSALDPVMTGEVLAVIADLAKEGQTMVVVTHAMHFARNVATTVHVFADGKDVEFGPPDKVFGNPKHPTTKAFLAETTRG
ncbi:MAG: amino acid ABC transporter ATP-binding protein [Planctomycetes bacterium]|nr:amino acid ABC transporter ATP-binding protein [Planctomycetota bacterium]